VLRAYFTLVHVDIDLARSKFASLYEQVRTCPVRGYSPDLGTVDRVCKAVDLACIWYWKDVLCLQRSATTALLLKKHGVRAQLVIGAQQLPFKAHAWVEVEGRIVNDKPYTGESYAVIERC
jgi:hypothetical protein